MPSGQSSSMPPLKPSSGVAPDLWSDEVIHQFYRPTLMRMITPAQLDALIVESMDIPQLENIHDALCELRWRRSQGKVEERIHELVGMIKRRRWYDYLKFWK